MNPITNTDGDYLWDKTGEPDPEIQQLEEILGTLRYQPRPLEIPAGFQVSQERNFFRRSAPRLAIAAAITLMLLGLGLWLGLQRLHRLERNQPRQVAGVPETPKVNPAPVSSPEQNRNASLGLLPGKPEPGRSSAPHRQRINPALLAGNANRRRNVKDQQFTAKEQQEAEAAKAQLMLALRVTSAKLNDAQRRTNSKDSVHNQHKIG
jgi:hypothetical protein